MRCVVAGSYRRFHERILDEVIPVFEEAGIQVLYPPKSRIINDGESFPIFEDDDPELSSVDDPELSSVDDPELDAQVRLGYFLTLPCNTIERVQSIKRLKRRGAEVPAEFQNKSPEQVNKEIALEKAFLNTASTSDFVYVYNRFGYIGYNTFHELLYLLMIRDLKGFNTPPVYALHPLVTRKFRYFKSILNLQMKKPNYKPGLYVQWDVFRDACALAHLDRILQKGGGYYKPTELVTYLITTSKLST